jgi:site-specific recombinase XerC
VDRPAVKVSEPADPQPVLLQSFCQWMREHRGSSERTLYNYGVPIGALIRRFGEDPSALDARCLRNFVLQQSRSTGWAGAKRCTTALRMFLRFLIAEGRCLAALLAAIPIHPI